MMKQKCFLLASLFAAALPSAAVMAQAEGDDFTSHIVNAGFDEGPDLERSFATGNRGTFYAPVGWDVTYHASTMASGSQHFNMDQYSADAPGANGMTSEDNYTLPLLVPDGEGYYQHAFFGAYNSPILTISQTLADLPAGTYTLTADGCVLEQDENGWFQSMGYNYYAYVDNETLGSSMQAEFPHYMHEAISNPAGTPTTPPELTTVSLDFVVSEDNQPVVVRFEYSFPNNGNYYQQIYLDNVTLTRTGDKESIVKSINQQTEMVYVPRMRASYDALSPYAPADWEQRVWDYEDPVDPDVINTMDLATAYQEEIIAFTAHIDSLIEQRSVLQTTIDSALSAETLNYPGLTELQTLRKAAQADFEQAPGVDLDVIMGHIATLEAAFPEYVFSALGSATPENPMDLTFLITNPTVEGSTGSMEPDCAPGWWIEVSGSDQQYLHTNGSAYEDGVTYNTTTYFNTWNGTAGAAKYLATQTLTGLPNGTYRLTADLSGDLDAAYTASGAYIFGQSAGIYSTAESDGSGVFKTYTTGDIIVVDGTMTIGTTTRGDELWGGNPFGGTWFSCDDFRLAYCGSDVSGIKDLLDEVIAESEIEIENAGETVLKGDMTEIDGILAAAKELSGTEPMDPEAIAEYIPTVMSVADKVAATMEAYTSINDAIAEAQLYLEADSATEAGLEALNVAIAEATAYLALETAVAAEADSVVGVLNKAINNIRVHSEGQDVTFLITNPDMTDWTNGYVMENTNVDYYGAPSDYELNVPHLCYWQGQLKDDAAFNYYQTISSIPNGYYKLTVNGLYAAAWETDNSGYPNDSVVFYALSDPRYEEQVPFTSYHVAIGDTVGGTNRESHQTMLYTLDSIMVNNGTMTFGVRNIGYMTCTTVRFYGFRLTYLGGAEEIVPPVGIIDAVADEQDFTVYTSNGRIIVEGTEDYVVYTMSGLPVDKDASLPAGIYLVRAGSRTKAIAVD